MEEKEILNDSNPLPVGKETDDKTTMRVTVDDKTPLKIWSREELIALQNEDPDIGPILRWKTKNNRPDWSDVAACSATTKSYWAQLMGFVRSYLWNPLSALGRSRWTQGEKFALGSESNSERYLATSTKLLYGWTLWNQEDHCESAGKVLLVLLKEICGKLLQEMRFMFISEGRAEKSHELL